MNEISGFTTSGMTLSAYFCGIAAVIDSLFFIIVFVILYAIFTGFDATERCRLKSQRG